MGVKSLTTFISTYYDEALEWHQLRDCKVVIDGNNLAFGIFYSCKNINRAFGGDYDKYAVEVENFFKKLKLCNITPIIVMDGGQPLKRKKFGTAMQRNKESIRSCLHVNPDNQNYYKIFPLLSFSVFSTVAQEMGIDIIQSDFEADDDIAVLAREMNAYVISNDSDFFLFDVPFVLLNSLNYTNVQKRKSKNGSLKFIPCYRFNHQKFSELSGVHKDLFPIFALVLGNDYHDTVTMKIFYRKFDSEVIKTVKGKRHKLIKCVIHWLAQQKPDPISVMKKVLKYLPPTLSEEQKDVVKKIVTEYSPKDSNLLSWINPHQDHCPLSKRKSALLPLLKTSLVPYGSAQFLPNKVKLELSCKCRTRARTKLVAGNRLPVWFVHVYRHHLVFRFVGDLLNKNYFFAHPLIEVESYDSSYLQLEDVVKGIRAILWGTIIKYDKNATKADNLNVKFRGLLLETDESKPSSESDHADEGVHNEDPAIEELAEVPQDEVSVNAEERRTCTIADDHLTSDSEDEDSSFDNLLQTIKLECIEEEASADDNVQTNDLIMDLPMSKVSGNFSAAKLPPVSDQFSSNSPLKLIDNDDEPEDSDFRFEPIKDTGPHLENNFDEDISDDSEDDEDEYYEGMDDELKLSEICQRREIPSISLYTRKGKVCWAKVIPSESLSLYEDYPTLFQMETLPESNRKALFYKICNLEVDFGEKLPKNLEFILTIICVWYSKHKDHVTLTNLLSTLMSVIMFSIVDGKYGRKRDLSHFTMLKELSKSVKQNVQPLAEGLSEMSIANIIISLTKDECLLASLNLHQFHSKSSNIRKKNYDRCVVHAFSHYQATIYFLSILNSTLFLPFPSVNVKSFWSGTFTYNLDRCFSAQVNPYLVLKCLLGDNLRILHLFMRLYGLLKKNLDIPSIQEEVLDVPKEEKGKAMNELRKKVGVKKPMQLRISTVSKKERTKQKEKKEAKATKILPEFDTLEGATEDDLLALATNKFSLLLSEPVAQ